MQRYITTDQSGRSPVKSRYAAVLRLALDEHELSQRWGLSVKTLRRWRQEKLGPIFARWEPALPISSLRSKPTSAACRVTPPSLRFTNEGGCDHD